MMNPNSPIRPKETPDNTPAITSEASQPRNHPNREKLGIEFSYDKGGRLYVHLRLPLDLRYPAEARAAELPYGYEQKKFLDVRYTPDIDLTAQMQGLSERIKNLLDPTTALGQVLRQDEAVKLSDAQLNEVIYKLAEYSKYIFYILFEKIEIYEDKEIKLAAIKSVFSHEQVIHITSPEPLLPWAFMYYLPDDDPDHLYNLPKYDPANPDPRGFWGFMHEIQEELPCTSQTLPLPPDCKVVSSVCAIVDNQQWHQQADHPLIVLGERVVLKSTEHELGHALGDFEWDCFYFFGHSYHAGTPTAQTSWIKLLNKELTVANLETRYKAPNFKQKPVVAFLNGCSTAALTQWNTETIAGYLCEQGRGSVCCLVAVDSLPAALAAEFAKHFWRYFLCDRQRIGRAMLNARKDILHTWKNPLGLLYSLFGRVDTFVESSSVEHDEAQRAAAARA
jgi:hypothetical protein